MSDKSPENTVRSKPIMERHLQTLLLALVAGLISWQGYSTLRLNESSARQDERVSYLITLTEQLRQDMRNMDALYMPRREYEMYRNETRSKLDQLESRVSRLEGAQ